jgi:hypothetical protein
VLLLVTSVLCAQQKSDPVINKIIKEGSENSQVMALLDHLTNRIGPRLTGSDQLIRSCEWALAEFKSWGLEATMEKWGDFAVGFDRGPWRGVMISPKVMPLTFGTNAWTPGTKGTQRGPAVMAPLDENELAAMEGGLDGKWVLEPRRDKVKDQWRARLRELYKESRCLGVIRSTGSDLVKTSGNSRITWDKLPTLVRINMIKDHYDAIAKEIAAGQKVELEFDIRNYFRKGPVPAYNVIAELKGSEKPDEYVVIGGHIDSWDGATGTIDNGTGVTTTMEAARLLVASGARPKRSILFQLWGGEEQGLLGSRGWCNAHEDKLENISAVFVHDGGTNYVSGLGVTKEQHAAFKKVVAPALDLDEKMKFKLSVAEGGLRGGGSDHAAFLRKGVPGFYWRQSGRARYGQGWHTQKDTFDMAIPEYQRHSAVVIALVAYGVANLPEKLSRKNLINKQPRRSMTRGMGFRLKDSTMTVANVRENSSASKAGLKVGDILVSIDGKELKTRMDLMRAMMGGKPEKKLVVKRKGEHKALTLKWQRRSRRSR